MAWSVNCRLIVAQLTLALILLYLHNINKMMQLDGQLRRSEFDHLPHPVHPPHRVENDGVQLGPRSSTLLLPVSRSQNAVQSDVVRCPHIPKPNVTLDEDWQRQDHPSGTVYVYSAVYDSRPVQRDPDIGTIRLLVLASGLHGHDPAVYCQVWYAEISEPVVVRAELIELDADVGQLRVGHQIYVQYFVSCLLYRSPTNAEEVSVTVGDRCGPASTLVPIQQPAAAATETTEIGICAILAWPVSAESSREFPLSAPWLLEWMELQLTIFGASRVFLYAAFDEDLRPLKQLIRLYADRKSLVVRRIPHPVEGQKRQRREAIGNLRALAVNDCLLRNARQFRYLIDVDVDELIVPRRVAQNYSDMIARIDSSFVKNMPQLHGGSSSAPSVYFFHVLSFLDDVPTDDPNYSRFTTTGYFRSRDRPEKEVRRAMIDSSRCVVVSPSTGCDVAATADAATSVKDDHVDVPLNVAGCHRYRRACASDVECETVSRHLSPIKDNTMLRFQPRLKFPLIQALKDSGAVDKADLYQVALHA